MQQQTKYFIIGIAFLIANLTTAFVFAQNENENLDKQACQACITSPEGITRYVLFVKGALAILESTAKIDFSGTNQDLKKAQINVGTDYIKQESDSYMGVINNEGRIIGSDIQGTFKETISSFQRDFLQDFARQLIVGLKSSALVRDENKLEQLDESIDRKVIVLINNFVFNDQIPQDQLNKLKGLFLVYSDIFVLDQGFQAFENDMSYQDFIGWINYTQRIIKNSVVFKPKKDSKYEVNKGVNYYIKQDRYDSLKSEYTCVKANAGIACNPSFGKIDALGKEFGQNASKDVKITLNKFKTSFDKLAQLFKKDENGKGYFSDYFNNFLDDRLVYNNQNIGNVADGARDAKTQKDLAQKLLEDCIVQSQQNPTQYETTTILSVFSPKGKIISCRKKSVYKTYKPSNLSTTQANKIQTIQNTMNNTIRLIVDIDETQDAYANLSSPISTSKQFPKLSKLVYDTKSTVQELNINSIQGCLAFCSNLNDKVKCGN